MLNDIEVLISLDNANYWTSRGYRVPDTPHNTVQAWRDRIQAGAGDPQRSAVVHHQHPQRRQRAGGDAGVRRGASPSAAIAALPRRSVDRWRQELAADRVGADQGTYGFRQWQTQFTLPARGARTLMVRCTNTRRGAARFPDLEFGRLHVQYH